MLDTADFERIGSDIATWEKVVRKLRTGTMPPATARRPEKDAAETFVTELEERLDEEALAHPDPGRPVIHRLNRTEYANAIRDLLDLEVDVSTLLPPDDSSYGFDNIADVLGVSPTLLERYLSAARKISRLAVGSPAVRPSVVTYRAPIDLTQDDQLDGLPFGTRGGLQISHNFPVDGEYVFKAKLGRNVHEIIRGLNELHQLEVSVDGVRVKLFDVGGFGSPSGKEADNRYRAKRHGQFRQYDFEVRAPVAAGPHVVTVTFLKKGSWELEESFAGEGGSSRGAALRPPFLRANIDPYSERFPFINQVLIDGPYGIAGSGNTPSRQRIFVCRPAGDADEARCANRILASLARRAYRRPTTEGDVASLMQYYDTGRKQGLGFEGGVERALRALLAQPDFLFRVERDPVGVVDGGVYQLSDLELASRLSFFLWSSIPDDELLNVAISGRLHDPAVLDQQVQRMLADGRSHALTTNFTDQWLQLRNLQFIFPSYYDFDDNLRTAMRRETQLFFESILRENRSAVDLLSANYTFLNERLARHYGIPNVQGDHFRRFELPANNPRRGLIGQASILTTTSYASRTSPVLRGKWILENVLGSPPPPPPPNVPPLNEDAAQDGRVLSMRERMAKHRSNPVCASCHSRMDPLGLSLEPFDEVGRYRTRDESNERIDASGQMPDGVKFDGPTGLGAALLTQSDAFITVLTEKLLTYAIGRGLEPSDQPAVRAIIRQAAGDDYGLGSIVGGIIKSVPFQMRRARRTAPAPLTEARR